MSFECVVVVFQGCARDPGSGGTGRYDVPAGFDDSTRDREDQSKR